MTELEYDPECHHLKSHLWYASLARSLWQGSLPTVTHDGPHEYMPLWWGPVVLVRPGDEVVLLHTLVGTMIDEVRPSA